MEFWGTFMLTLVIGIGLGKKQSPTLAAALMLVAFVSANIAFAFGDKID